MQKITLPALFIYFVILSIHGQNREYELLNKNPMDTVVFVIDTTSSTVNYQDSSIYPFYYNRDFKEPGFKITIKGRYLYKYKDEIKIEPDFQKIFLEHLLSDAYWFNVEQSIINLKKSEIKKYKIYDEKYLANLDDIYILRNELGPVPWLKNARCFLIFKTDWNSKNCSPLKLYRIGISYNDKRW